MKKIGFITNCLEMSLDKKIEIAERLGYQTLEVACWPKGNPKQCDIDAENIDSKYWEKIRKLLKNSKLQVITLAYYDNMLDVDIKIRRQNLQHLYKVINVASRLGISNVSTYIGKNKSLSINDNLELSIQIFKPIIRYATSLGITLLIENCPMPTWNEEGFPGTISYSPELLKYLFEKINSPYFGLNYDPSHFYWQQIDYIEAIHDLAPWIKSVHVKDVTINKCNSARYSLYGKKIEKENKFDFGYYQATLPGYGDIHWLNLMNTLDSIGFSGPYQIEYKNGNGFGKINDTTKGLKMSIEYFKSLIGVGMI